MSPNTIIVVPAVEEGRGGGHLTRCISLVNDLRALGRKAMLYLPAQTETSKFVNLFKSLNFNQSWLIFNEEIQIRNKNLSEKFDFIILDRFKTPLDELENWKKIAPVIGIDEGGDFREQFDFLIDILIPEKMGKPKANIANPALLFNKVFTTNHTNQYELAPAVLTRSKEKGENLKVLISFGQEDPAGLGVKTARKLSAINKKQKMDITLLKGNLSKSTIEVPSGVNVIDAIPNLAQHLHEYDLVITHYGLTSYEAVHAGVPVLLAHPTGLHRKLAKSAGFKSINKLNSFLNSTTNQHEPTRTEEEARTKGSCGLWLKNKNISLAELVNSLAPIVNRKCPVCGFVSGSDTARFSERTYRRCKKCGIIYMDRTCPPTIEYEKEYFFENYKKQYGKTYLEDFENIKNAGKNRLKIIESLFPLKEKNLTTEYTEFHGESKDFKLKPPCSSVSSVVSFSSSLLDIGCAYGPFLAAAKEAGFSPYGLDPAEDAVRYVQQELGFPAACGFFPHSLLPTPYSLLYDVVTLWFVIEHFTDCSSVLTEVKKILKPGGILAFSTPSFSGISGRKALRNFLSASPADHFTVWSPKSAKKALSLAGFKVKKIVVVGHHPERFPILGKLAKSKVSPMYWLLLAISKLFSLGDTFEVYAQMIKK